MTVTALAADPADGSRRDDSFERIEWEAVRLVGSVEQDVFLWSGLR
jgi:hypothetical protein